MLGTLSFEYNDSMSSLQAIVGIFSCPIILSIIIGVREGQQVRAENNAKEYCSHFK